MSKVHYNSRVTNYNPKVKIIRITIVWRLSAIIVLQILGYPIIVVLYHTSAPFFSVQITSLSLCDMQPLFKCHIDLLRSITILLDPSFTQSIENEL